MNLVQTAVKEKQVLTASISKPPAVLHTPVRPDYVSPPSVQDVIAFLKSAAHPLPVAGGLDVVGRMRNSTTRPQLLVSLKNLKELQHISQTGQAVALGAGVKIRQLVDDPAVKTAFPALAEAAASVGYPQIRNMGTLAGNLCQEPCCWYYRRSPDTGNYFDCRRKNPCGICYAKAGLNQYHALEPDLPCAAVCPSDPAMMLAALDARVITQNGDGSRNMPITALYGALGTNLRKDELITGVNVPDTFAGCPQAYLKFRIRKATDFAIVSAAVTVKYHLGRIADARIILGGMANRPYRAVEAESMLINKGRPDEAFAKTVAAVSVSGFTPLSLNKYKLTVGQTLVRRALLQTNTQKGE